MIASGANRSSQCYRAVLSSFGWLRISSADSQGYSLHICLSYLTGLVTGTGVDKKKLNSQVNKHVFQTRL